jgi:hypothetical protein
MDHCTCQIRGVVIKVNHLGCPSRHWKMNVDVLMPRRSGDCHPFRHGYYESYKTIPCEFRLISKQNDSYKLCVYNAFCEKPSAKHHPCTMVRRSMGLHSLDVVWVEWLFMENYPDKGTADTFRKAHWIRDRLPLSTRELLENSAIPQQALTSVRLDVCCLRLTGAFKWTVYPLKACNPFYTLQQCDWLTSSLNHKQTHTVRVIMGWEKRKCSENILSQCHSVHHECHVDCHGAYHGLRGEKLVTAWAMEQHIIALTNILIEYCIFMVTKSPCNGTTQFWLIV